MIIIGDKLHAHLHASWMYVPWGMERPPSRVKPREWVNGVKRGPAGHPRIVRREPRRASLTCTHHLFPIFCQAVGFNFWFHKKYKEIETLHENKYRKFSSSKLLQIFWINRVRFPLDFFRRKKLFPCWIWNEALKVARREGARLRALCGLTNDARHVQI